MSTSTEVKTGRVVRGAQAYRSEQGTVYAPGVSAETVASKVLFLGLVTLPPGERTKAHIHAHHESAFYLLSGDEVSCGAAIGLIIGKSPAVGTISSFRPMCRMSRSTEARLNPPSLSAYATSLPRKKAS